MLDEARQAKSSSDDRLFRMVDVLVFQQEIAERHLHAMNTDTNRHELTRMQKEDAVVQSALLKSKTG